MLLALGQLITGLVVLTLGGELLVRASISIAVLANLSTAVIGLTVVAFGTSLPELAVSLNAAAQGATDISYSNVAGSNIFNIAAILGIVAVLHPLTVSRQTFRFEYPAMAFAIVAMLAAAADGVIGRVDGVVGAIALVTLGIAVYVGSQHGSQLLPDMSANEREVVETGRVKGSPAKAWTTSLAYLALGLVGLQFGSNLILDGSIGIARILGITERVIGLTAIAMGTSLPELATTIIATRKGESALALSNLLGSNIFNTFGVLALTALVFPVPVNPRAASLDNWVMFAFVAALLPILWYRARVSRWEGAILLTGFAAYMAVLIGSATTP